ncbi:MAG TPA: hypothetical protein VML75_11995 [Kofleriaceae bacterium]|nr:hypothetical protein [Kofleriaceae bacterium]
MSGHDRSEHPAELLAAYADGGLTGSERARVEAYLAADPQAQADVEALRAVINATRAVQPRPATEPAWDEMARAIRAACRDAGPVPPRGVIGWLRELLRPRYAGSVLVVAAAVVLLVVWSGRRDAAGPGPELATTERVAVSPTTTDDRLPGVLGWRAEEIEDLESAELDVLLAELDPAAISEIEDPAEDAVMPDEAIPDWSLAESSSGEDDFFGMPDYGALLDELSEAEIDALDAFLASQTG